MTYEPQPRQVPGEYPMNRSSFRCMCDVCGKPRNRGKHLKCAEARKKAGFRS